MRALVAALVTLLVLAGAGSAQAATFMVTKTADAADGTCDGDCSLREATIAANSNAGADTITVPAGHYVLSIDGTFEDDSATGDLDINDATAIVDAGARSTTIDANQIDRVIEIPPIRRQVARQALGGPAPGLSISGVTITGGQPPNGTMGGGISVTTSDGSLDLSDSTVTGNNIPTSKGPATGAGIFAAGSLTVTRSTISKNSTDQGSGGWRRHLQCHGDIHQRHDHAEHGSYVRGRWRGRARPEHEPGAVPQHHDLG